MAGASSSSDGGYRIFDGEQEDARESKRWKVWVTNKLLTMADKVPLHIHPAARQSIGMC